jgi:enoyl-CoA hydratase
MLFESQAKFDRMQAFLDKKSAKQSSDNPSSDNPDRT